MLYRELRTTSSSEGLVLSTPPKMMLVFALIALLPGTKSETIPATDVNTGTATMTVECKRWKINPTVTVNSDFDGLVYAGDESDDASLTTCQFTADDSDNTRYTKEFGYLNKPCGMTVTKSADGKDLVSLAVNVQFSQSMKLASDKRMIATCTYDNLHTAQTSFSEVGSEADLEGGEVAGDDPTFEFFKFELTDGDSGDALTAGDSLTLEDSITITATLFNSPIHKSMLLKNCFASNREDPADVNYVDLKLIGDNGCLAAESLSSMSTIIVTPPSYSDVEEAQFTKQFVMKMNPILFTQGRTSNTNELHLRCEVLLCSVDTASDCEQTCARERRSVAARGEVRGRRQAGGEGTETLSVSRNLLIVPSRGGASQDVANAAGVSAVSSDCMDDPMIQVTLATMGFFLLVFIVAVVVLTILFIRHRRRDVKKRGVSSVSSSVAELAPDYPRQHRG